VLENNGRKKEDKIGKTFSTLGQEEGKKCLEEEEFLQSLQ